MRAAKVASRTRELLSLICFGYIQALVCACTKKGAPARAASPRQLPPQKGWFWQQLLRVGRGKGLFFSIEQPHGRRAEEEGTEREVGVGLCACVCKTHARARVCSLVEGWGLLISWPRAATQLRTF